MSHLNDLKQVAVCNLPEVVYVYRYSQYENKLTGLVSKPSLVMSSHDVIAVNDRLIVLNDDCFTSLTIDGTNFAGKNALDMPALYTYIGDKYYGDGIIFSISTSEPLTMHQLNDIICEELMGGQSALVDIEFTLLSELERINSKEAQ